MNISTTGAVPSWAPTSSCRRWTWKGGCCHPTGLSQQSPCRLGCSEWFVCLGWAPVFLHCFRIQLFLWSSRGMCCWPRRTLALRWAKMAGVTLTPLVLLRGHARGPGASWCFAKQGCHGYFVGRRANKLCLHIWKCNMFLKGWRLLMRAPVLYITCCSVRLISSQREVRLSRNRYSLGKHSVCLVFTENSKQKKAVVLERNHSTVAWVRLVSKY